MGPRSPFRFMLHIPFSLASVCLLFPAAAPAQPARDWRASALPTREPSDDIVRLDLDGDGRPDIVERWWNGRRVRWLDENGDLRPDDTRGDQVADVLQVDIDGDGLYDGLQDQNVKWADNDGDGRPDLQAWAVVPKSWGPEQFTYDGHWMLFIDVEKDAVLGWEDWTKFVFDCWGHTGVCDWLPDYNGDAVFLKAHAGAHSMEDPRLSWENPFAFYDEDDDGVTEMAMRWLDPYQREGTVSKQSGTFNEAFVSLDLDNDAVKGNEMDFDLSLRGTDGPGVPYMKYAHKVPALKGNPKFDPCFQWNNWRRTDELIYMPHDRSWGEFFAARWGRVYLTFDEDDDDHRWERCELYYPTDQPDGEGPRVDPYSLKRWKEKRDGVPPGLCAHSQSDTLGDRGEFDMDNSGKGMLYIGVFDRKLHLVGAEWGAWTVDKDARFHAGWAAPPPRPRAEKVEEVVTYADTDGNGFLDKVEFDYDGDRAVDFAISLLDWRADAQPRPDVVPVIDTRKEGWQGLHALFTAMANDAWQEALRVYRAAWRRGLTTPELDKLAHAASVGERYDHAYWVKEKVFRLIRARIAEVAAAEPGRAAELDALEKDLARLYYTGRFEEYVRRIGEVPGR